MKKMMMMMLLIIATAGIGFADDTVIAGDIQGFSITTPFETGVTAFYFPTDKTIAGGISETVLRARWVDTDFPTLSKIAVDLDLNIAKEVNEAGNSLYGPGLKVNYDVDMLNDSGFVFKPSVGITAVRNLKGLNTVADVIKDFRVAIYGSIVLYKF